MDPIKILLAPLFLLIVMTACGGAVQTPQIIQPQMIALGQDVPVIIRARSGNVFITNGETGQAELSGEVFSIEKDVLDITSQSDGLYITACDREGNPGCSVTLNLHVPPGTLVRVETYDAGVTAENFTGGVDVTSTTGDVLLQNLRGTAVLRVNRGDVLAEDSSGVLKLLGNYGLLNLQNVSGEIVASTIMGVIRYQGQGNASDQIYLETDHGPVEIWLTTDSDLVVSVTTTSGDVDCVIPGLAPKGSGCAGQLGSGAGSLKVRTISGEVDLQPIP